MLSGVMSFGEIIDSQNSAVRMSGWAHFRVENECAFILGSDTSYQKLR
jgi:hypothetical protein